MKTSKSAFAYITHRERHLECCIQTEIRPLGYEKLIFMCFQLKMFLLIFLLLLKEVCGMGHFNRRSDEMKLKLQSEIYSSHSN